MTWVVALFFFMSGYLYFVNIGEQKFSFAIWKNKSCNRVKSLVIPYILWNLLVLALFAAAQSLTGNAGTIQKDGYKLIADYQFIDFLKAIWALDSTGFPIDGPLWFVRDLMITSIFLSYPIWWIVKRTGVCGLLTIFFAWHLDLVELVPGISFSCVFYFSVGAFCAINNFDLFSNVSKKTSHQMGATIILSLAVYSILAALHSENASLYRQVFTNITILLIFGWLASYIRERKVKAIAFLGNASFFIFAMHKPLQVIVRRYSFAILHPASEIELSLMAIIVPAIVITLCLLAFYIVRHYMPYLKCLNGFRI